jgi:FkbM family methyltransferase
MGTSSEAHPTSTLNKLAYRLDVIGLKSRGLLPGLSWSEVLGMMGKSCDYWPVEKLVQATENNGTTVLYHTPIGNICHGVDKARVLGLLVIEQLRDVYEQGQVRVLRGDIVIDLGANVGTFTRYALNRGASKVIAFEPEPSNLERLRRGFADEIRQGTVVLIDAAAWETETTLRFAPSGLTSCIDESGPIEIRAVRIDDVVSRLGLPQVNFIKADIEGAERHALLGARETIARCSPRMALCVYHLPDDPKVISNTVRSVRPYAISMNRGRTQAFFMPA